MVRTRHFTLLELIIAVGILAVFLFICTSTFTSTLEIKREIRNQYDSTRLSSLGWNLMHRDLAHAVGIYYHHYTLWEPSPTGGDAVKKVDPKKKDSKKKKKTKSSTSDELLIFNASPSGDEPFLELVISKGRLRDVNVEEETVSSGFRKVKYYLTAQEEGYGDMILRTEERWVSKSQQKGKKSEHKEGDFDLGDVRRYGVLMDLGDVELSVYDGKEWVEEWSSLKEGDLPLALRLDFQDLSVDENSREQELQRRILPMPLSYRVVDEPEEPL
jgi:hypothetical protein